MSPALRHRSKIVFSWIIWFKMNISVFQPISIFGWPCQKKNFIFLICAYRETAQPFCFHTQSFKMIKSFLFFFLFSQLCLIMIYMVSNCCRLLLLIQKNVYDLNMALGMDRISQFRNSWECEHTPVSHIIRLYLTVYLTSFLVNGKDSPGLRC